MLDIREKYFRVNCKGKSYTLYIIDNKGREKIAGYFTNAESAVRRACRILKKNNLPYKEYLIILKEYKTIKDRLTRKAVSIYNPIIKLKESIYGSRKR